MTSPDKTPTCRGCNSLQMEMVVSLGSQPACDLFPLATDDRVDPAWPLELWLCESCGLVQLGPIQPLLEEPPRAIESETSKAHAAESTAAVLAEHPELGAGTVREFASHHGGSWLEHLGAAGCRLAADGEPADFVVDVHGIAHEPEVGDVLTIRAETLAPDGLLVLEFHHLLALLEGTQFDTIRHGHWSYLSIVALENLARARGMQVVAVRATDVFGGSVRVTLAHLDSSHVPDPSVAAMITREKQAGVDDAGRLRELQGAMQRSVAAFTEFLEEQRAAGRSVLGYGAPSKAPVLIGVSGVGADLLEFTVDAAPAKHGRRLPGSKITIRSVDELVAARPDVVMIFTWDIADEVITQLEATGGWGAEYVVPLPSPHVVPGSTSRLKESALR
jgi:hypothetical protein